MNHSRATKVLPTVLMLLAFCFNLTLASGPAEKKGWGVDDPYNKLYDPKEFEKIKAKLVRVTEVVPMEGMSPATALEVSEGRGHSEGQLGRDQRQGRISGLKGEEGRFLRI